MSDGKSNNSCHSFNNPEHLEWSHKQSRILTANGTASEIYSPERGYTFHDAELPHHHLLNNTTHTAFYLKHEKCTPVIGAWKRPLFVGQWEHSTSDSETCFNIQTSHLFIDLRVPTTKPSFVEFPRTNDALRCYARQHVFGGCTVTDYEQSDSTRRRPVCTRHHFIDWNFVGVGRPRPNKWFVEMNDDGNVWKEWSYAKDDYGQCYYWERWERLQDGHPDLVFAMRKSDSSARDGIVVVVGNHFNFLLDRMLTGKETKYPSAMSLVDTVDTAIGKSDFETAASNMTIEGGHGTVNSGWMIDTAIQSWNEGTKLLTPESVKVIGSSVKNCSVFWNNEKWNVWECTLDSVAELERFLKYGSVNASRL